MREDSTVTMELVETAGAHPVARIVVSESLDPRTEPRTLSLIGLTVSHYRILAHLGKGGMGVVYRAQDVRLGRHVAIKFASKEFQTNPAICECIRREAHAGSALNHVNVCGVYDIGDFHGRPFIVMELLEGRSLRQVLEVPMRVERFLDLAIQIASGLEAVHSCGIVHRDIKPSNIFVTSSGQAKIVDFGLAILASGPRGSASLTDPRKIRGTPAYMSPEQILGERLDWRTDLFSAGAVFYEMLTGERPFHGVTTSEVLSAVARGPFIPVCQMQPELPAGFEALIGSALEKDRSRRCQSAAELCIGLQRIQRDAGLGNRRS